jgi:hypothetical protein
MATTRYFFQASQEHFPPEDLLALRGARVA